jgi:predicted Fe-S protein YdhL (DUF1289 family)
VSNGAIESPCRKTCEVDRGRRICLSCRRTFDEIGSWRSMTAGQRVEVMGKLEARRAADR